MSTSRLPITDSSATDRQDLAVTLISLKTHLLCMNPGEENPYNLFMRECPSVFGRLNDLIDAQRTLPGLDQKTKQLINIAIQTATRNPRGVFFHAGMAKSAGATREEIIGAVVMNLHLSGLATVLESLPAAVKGYAVQGEAGTVAKK